jgi:hypothetical protein
MGTNGSKTSTVSNLCDSKPFSSILNFSDYDETIEPATWYEKIHDKLEKSGELSNITSEEEKKKLIRSLGDDDLFLEKYLELDKHQNKVLLEKLQAEVQCASDIGINDEEEAEGMIDSLLDYRRRATEFDVRIFFTRIEGLNTNNIATGLAGRIATYGPVHVGLVISGTPLHWNTNSLVSCVVDPKPLLSYSRVYLGRMRYDENMFERVIKESKVSTVQQAENYYQRLVQMHYDTKREAFMKLGQFATDKLRKIAQTCVLYNKTKTYHLLTCNCQTFVDDILKAIGMEFKPEDEFKLFMERIRTSDSNNGSFIYINQNFKSRKEFDRYVDENWKTETSIWNKRLLIQYSDLMENMFLQSDKKDTNWGPMTKRIWSERLESIF